MQKMMSRHDPCSIRVCTLGWFPLLVWFGLVWFGLVWFGLVWFGLVWFGLSLVSFLFLSFDFHMEFHMKFLYGVLYGVFTTNIQSLKSTPMEDSRNVHHPGCPYGRFREHSQINNSHTFQTKEHSLTFRSAEYSENLQLSPMEDSRNILSQPQPHIIDPKNII
jgi:hypothetical protein